MLPNDYIGQPCSLARTLEVVGERWTLLIVRDAFYGVRRFGDFATHLQIPRGVLAERLKSLLAAGVLERVPGRGARSEYALSAKGRSLWPVIRAMTSWGDMHYAPAGPRRLFRHVADGGDLDVGCRCSACGAVIEAGDAEVSPGPGLEPPRDEPVARALTRPHRLTEPLIALNAAA